MIAVAGLGFAAACASDTALKPSDSTSPGGGSPAVGGQLKVGDLVTVNVNGKESCTNPVYRAARVISIGAHALILNDTLNPKGFSQADFDRFAARFDTLVYPLDVETFGAPTDIDVNGHIALLFTRAVNELTPRSSSSYVGGFAYARDLFPLTNTARAKACATSNQGEIFYLLTPDPTGSVNGNVRTTRFVDSVTTSVLAHELQHIINSSRRLYVSNAAFEEKWLDEGLAHIAEELLFYREGGATSRANLGATQIRARAALSLAFSSDMDANVSRYRTYLQAPQKSSPYAADDSLPTRGAAWSLLRYAVDRVSGAGALPPGQAQTVTGGGDVTVAPGATTGDYVATLVNTSLASGAAVAYSMVGVGVATPSSPPASIAGPGFATMAQDASPASPQRDVAFESALRDRERALAPLAAGARTWFAAQHRTLGAVPAMSRSSISADVDGTFFYALVNSSSVGIANLQAAVGGNLSTFVRDWSVSHIVDDIAQQGTQLQQPSWNFHSIFPALTGSIVYPLQVVTLANGVTTTGSIVPGGSAFFRFAVPANGSATVTLGAPAGGSSFQLVVVRTR